MTTPTMNEAIRTAIALTERPLVLHKDNQNRLHCEDGPALVVPGDIRIYAWHGTRVPQAMIEGKWTAEDILRETNAEVRRCAIEKMGWPEFIVKAGLKKVGREMKDPGNPGQTLALYDVPRQIYNTPIRVLICTNGTVERDGTRRSFGLTVPETMPSPLEAAAWTYGLTAEKYAGAQRRS